MAPRSKRLLVAAIALNLLCIGYFKYADFLLGSAACLFGLEWQALDIFLPLGISFFTFQEIACLVDTYRGKIGRVPLRKYALFVAFFPQLIAGPIVLADKLIPQFSAKRTFAFSWGNVYIGLILFAIGLFKKVVIADSLSPWVAEVFDGAESLAFMQAWGGALAYTFQLYFDFSGYSDMAIGLGRLFNIDIPVNFYSPYKATSIIDFWRRWHITLSGFLREYVYIPLGGNRKGLARRYVNLMLTMLLGGLWHGAGWTFVVCGGGGHGLYLVINHLWRKISPRRLPKPVGWALTFIAVAAAWVLFRSESLTRALFILKAMLSFGTIGAVDFAALLVWLTPIFNLDIVNTARMIFALIESREFMLIVAAIVAFAAPNAAQIAQGLRSASGKRAAAFSAFAGLLVVYTFLHLNTLSEFLYFQF